MSSGTKPLEVPSLDSDKETLFTFLCNPDLRKFYNQHIDKIKKYSNLKANNWFLQQCFERKIIPQSFMSKNMPKNCKSESFKRDWLETTKQHSLQLIEKALNDDKIKENKLLQEIANNFNLLVAMTPNENVYLELKARTIHKENSFLKFAMDKKLKKLNFLHKKQMEMDHENEESVAEESDAEETPTNDDSETPTSSKRKSKRVWTKKSTYRKQQKKLKKQKVSVVFNYSKIKISEGAEKALNRGLNFALLPDNLNITQLLADLDRFERTCEWKEFWHDKESDKKPSLFKTPKTNRPDNPPQGLKTFINSIRSEIEDPKNWNKVRPNLPPDELAGLKELEQLQKERKICIKPCDKGAGVIILDFEAYMTSCHNHLNSVQRQDDGSYKRYYNPVHDDSLVDQVKENIKDLLKTGFENGYITKEERTAMDPSDKGVGRFYELFKVHKAHQAPQTPPERPIISCSGSMTEYIGKFVEHHLKDVANSHESFLQDTPDFLRKIEELNEDEVVKDGDILVTIDVTGLYTNIPIDQGLIAAKKALDGRADQSIPTDFIISLLEVILKFNVFEFNKELFIQVIGTAMGAIPAVSYANIFMAYDIDPNIIKAAEQPKTSEENPIKFMKRFLDDLFFVWRGSCELLHKFVTELNSLHPSIKFTMSHTKSNSDSSCDCPTLSSLPFLDTSCYIEDNRIVTDLYKKETDRNQYLLTSSCHPAHVTDNIPFSLALRIVRICTKSEDREKRFSELKDMLLARNYKSKIIDSAIERARNIPRAEALKKVVKKSNNKTVFVVMYDPRFPSLTKIVNKHYRTMVQDPHLKEVFSEGFIIAYRRPKNIRQRLIRSKVPPPPLIRPKRQLKGMKKCKGCVTCPFVTTGKTVKATATNYRVDINAAVDCTTNNVIYCIECMKPNCRLQYIGQTSEPLKTRFNQHRGYVRNKALSKATGEFKNVILSVT